MSNYTLTIEFTCDGTPIPSQDAPDTAELRAAIVAIVNGANCPEDSEPEDTDPIITIERVTIAAAPPH